ncbi:probable 39S ribosomal protein L49, mitochondrial isoform X1 [Camponotus floridanus]|uniref:probable 39S ribosomal protein L49, mitochondrial isoform X1 n=1 Tax=Camponotus floridanus TaxID=104421 RepID=UPI00059CE682|nr:probable 39S ribosomal protein L49, mitochondrial isoform X1 [Camponotus floridanus]
MAALRIFARESLATILNSARTSSHVATSRVALVLPQIQRRWSSYKSSPTYTDSKNYTDYEITNDPNEWKYVERLFRYKVVPKPPTGDVKLPSGYKPACASPTDYPYFIQRTRNHMQPVYLGITHRGMRRLTTVKNIQGNIWELDHDIKIYLKKRLRVAPPSQIHEFSGVIKYKGDYVNRIKDWMNIKGF